MKVIGISIPCYNEEENVIPLFYAVTETMNRELPEYDYIIQYIDNNSEDSTQQKLRELCKKEKKVRAIFNAKNYKARSALYGLLQLNCDCVIYLSADFQDPVDKIPELIHKWEEGYTIVAAIKTASEEGKIKYGIRALFYKIMKRFSTYGFIEQFCNFGVYDKKFLDIIRGLHNPNVSIRGNVSEYGYNIAYIPYEQPLRRAGKSKYNVWTLFNHAIDNFVTYTNVVLRMATIGGLMFSVLFFLIAIIYLILKVTAWTDYPMGIAPMLIGIFLIGSIQTFLLGMIGEYLLVVKTKVTESPLVVVRERINFEDRSNDESILQ